MTVYTLETGLDYAGHSVVGVYASIEEVRAAADKYRKYVTEYFDELRVTELEVGATYVDGPARWIRRSGSEDWRRQEW